MPSRRSSGTREHRRTIEDLLDVSRIVSGNLRLQVSPIDLCQVVDDAVDVVRPAVEASHCSSMWSSRRVPC
jgi:signal transduction histidine kinase